MIIEKDFSGRYLNVLDFRKVRAEEAELLKFIAGAGDAGLCRSIVKDFFEVMPELEELFKGNVVEPYYLKILAKKYNDLINIPVPWAYDYDPIEKDTDDYLYLIQPIGIVLFETVEKDEIIANEYRCCRTFASAINSLGLYFYDLKELLNNPTERYFSLIEKWHDTLVKTGYKY